MNIIANIISAGQAIIAAIYQFVYTDENWNVYTDNNNEPYIS